MADGHPRSRWGTFLLGGLVGGLAGIAASRLRERPRAHAPLSLPGLAAFEAAPCFREWAEVEHQPAPRRAGDSPA